MGKFKKFVLAFVVVATTFNLTFSQIIGKVNVEANKTKYQANTVVYIEKANGSFMPPAKNPVINQKSLVFVPHVLPVVAGTTVDFLNSDDVVHNVFSPDQCCKFDLGGYTRGITKSQKFDKIGCQAVILCNVHPEMEAYVIVLQNSYFAVTNSEGNYKIENVPAGNYVLKVWNEKYAAKDQSITVPTSGQLEVNFNLAK